MTTEITAEHNNRPPTAAKLAYWSGVRTVFALEMRRRLRTRGWYIMLAVWFAVVGGVALLAWMTTWGTAEVGPMLFELVIGFVLFFGLLVAPALSANAVNGDRAGGTLAILQVTLLTPGQLLAGKWLAAWVASLGFLVVSSPFIIWALSFGDANPLEALVALVMVAVELGLVCAIGVGVSSVAGRPLFSIVTTYMLVALLSIGTLIGFALSLQLVRDQAMVGYLEYPGLDKPGGVKSTPEDVEPMPEELGEPTCSSELYESTIFHTDRTAWLLAANPYVVVADVVPYDDSPVDPTEFASRGIMEEISRGVRYAQAGAEYTTPCINGVRGPSELPQDVPPQWPLGLAIQGLLAGGLVWAGRHRLVTPVRRLPRGTRIA